jgi:YVTN family beta-propeller protein
MANPLRLTLMARAGALLGVATAVVWALPASGREYPAYSHTPSRVVQSPAAAGGQPISSRDRVYTADMASNTVSVIDPKAGVVLGTIPLGSDSLGQILGPKDTGEVGVHGLGFSRDGRRLDVISVNSNSAQLIDTQNNKVLTTTYVGRSPHEGFVAPDGQSLWVAVRGQRYVSVLSTRTGRELQRIRTADGPSKVVFSPDGALAYVNHLRARVVEVIRVPDRRIVKRIFGTAPESSDEAISPDGRELWLGHPFTGQTTVIDARRMRVLAILNTGPRTNHPQFVTKPDGRNYAYLTVGGLNQTLVFLRDGARPRLVRRIQDHGFGPHGIWPSPDNTRIYVALQNSDAVDVIDTSTDTVINTLHVGQDPMALVYVANAVPTGGGRRGLSRQGLGQPVQTLPVAVDGTSGSAALTVRRLQTIDQLVFNARGLPARATFTVEGVRSDDTVVPLFSVRASASGTVDQAISYTDFFGVYPQVSLAPAQPGMARASSATSHFLCEL